MSSDTNWKQIAVIGTCVAAAGVGLYYLWASDDSSSVSASLLTPLDLTVVHPATKCRPTETQRQTVETTALMTPVVQLILVKAQAIQLPVSDLLQVLPDPSCLHNQRKGREIVHPPANSVAAMVQRSKNVNLLKPKTNQTFAPLLMLSSKSQLQVCLPSIHDGKTTQSLLECFACLPTAEMSKERNSSQGQVSPDMSWWSQCHVFLALHFYEFYISSV